LAHFETQILLHIGGTALALPFRKRSNQYSCQFMLSTRCLGSPVRHLNRVIDRFALGNRPIIEALSQRFALEQFRDNIRRGIVFAKIESGKNIWMTSARSPPVPPAQIAAIDPRLARAPPAKP
jgi:hypothetical protein